VVYAPRLRNGNFAVQDLLVSDIRPVHRFVSTVVGLYDGAIYASSGNARYAPSKVLLFSGQVKAVVLRGL
jgi:hypothetical protein